MIFKLFACCIPVAGARRSIICDLQRGNFKFIPNALYHILVAQKGMSVDMIKSFYENQFDEYIDSYYEFLEINEFGFWCDSPDLFPDIEMDWHHPSLITNAIVDIDSGSHHDLEKISQELDVLGCEGLQIRIYNSVNINSLVSYIQPFGKSRIRSIEVLMKYSSTISLEEFNDLCINHQRIRSIIVHSSPMYKKTSLLTTEIPLLFTNEDIKDHKHCGIVNSSYFAINISSFSESINYNSCLNKKISIDINGEIRNCPSMTKAFGNIKDTSLLEALNIEGFKDYWSINKDQINVCRDCEFRYICTDCRAFTQSGGKLEKPKKCTYDPYTALWKE